MITVTDKSTGELHEFRNTLEAWQFAQNLEKLAKELKDRCRPILDKEMGGSDIFVVGQKAFRRTYRQYRSYDPSLLRGIIKDEDVLEAMMKPDSKLVNEYAKEQLKTDPVYADQIKKCEVPETDEFGNPKVSITISLGKF